MPRIPTYSAQLSKPNFNPVEGNPQSAAMPYNAAAGMFEAVGRTGEMIGAVLNKRKEQAAATEASEKHSEFRNELDKWSVENQNREDYGDALKQYGTDLAQSKMSDFRTREGGEMFSKQARLDVDGRYGKALEIGERNRFNNAQLTEQNAATTTANSYRSYIQIDPQGADALVRNDIKAQSERIDKSFLEVAPNHAAALKEDALYDIITGVMEASPETALELIDEYPLDERRRKSLRGEATSRLHIRNALQVQQFSQGIEDVMDEAKAKMEYAAQPTVEAYKSIYKDDDVAQAEYNRHKVQFDTHNIALAASREMIGKNPAVFGEVINKVRNADPAFIKGEVKLNVLKQVFDNADKLNRERDHDVAAYVRKYAPSIQRLEASKVGMSPEKVASVDMQIASEVLRKQGPPPAPDILGNEVYDKDYYQNLPSHQKKVLTKAQAADYAGALNSGTPDQKIAALARFNVSFGEDTKHIAWRDLTSLPSGEAVKEGVQLASLHLGTDVAKQVLVALQSKDDNLKRKGVEISDYNKAITSNPDWQAFSQAYAGDGTQSAESIAGFRDSIAAFALSLDAGTARDAVASSIKTLLSKKFMFDDVNGRRVAFAKFSGPDGRDISDDEMSIAIIPKVKEVFNNLDFSNVLTTSPDGINLFPAAPPGVSDATLADYLNTQLATEKRLVPSEDGKGFYVYMQNMISHIPTQLFTKDKRPLFIPYYDAEKRRNAPQKAVTPKTSGGGPASPEHGVPEYILPSVF